MFADQERRLTPAPGSSEIPQGVSGETPPRVSASVADHDGNVIATVTRYCEYPSPGIDAGDVLTVVAFTGDIDLDSATLLERVLTTAIDGREKVCCDLSGAAFVGAAGANTLLAAHWYAVEAGRHFAVRGANEMARQVFAITGLDQVLMIHD
jgi:anti-anti-sigma factor